MSCQHEFVIEAKDVFAKVELDQKGKPTTLGRSQTTVRYDKIVYCNHPTCEKVFEAQRHEPVEMWQDTARPNYGEN